MMHSWFCLAFGLVACATAPVFADDRRAGQMAAALNLAAAGIDREEVAPVMVAREMLADLAPTGAAVSELQKTWDSEARFLARGDADILARLGAIKEQAADPSLHVMELGNAVRVPEGQGLSSVAVPDSVRLISVTVEGEPVCVPDSDLAIWRCEPARARGAIVLEAEGGDEISHLVFTTEVGG